MAIFDDKKIDNKKTLHNALADVDFDQVSEEVQIIDTPIIRQAKFGLGARVKHRVFPFRGVVMDIDVSFDNTEEWYNAIPKHLRPHKDQPFYHLLAENQDKSVYFAYVSEQNLLPDTSSEAMDVPEIAKLFSGDPHEGYRIRRTLH